MAKRLRALGPARRGAHGLCAAPRRHCLAEKGGWISELQARGPGPRQRPAARKGARRAVRRARHHRAGAADPQGPAQIVRLRLLAAQEGPGAAGNGPAGRAGACQALPARQRHDPARARLHRRHVAAGHAPHQQERDHLLGSGAGPVRAGLHRRGHAAPAPVLARGRPARGHAAPAHQEHPRQQVAHGGRQPQDAEPGHGRAMGHRCGAVHGPCGHCT